jgi:hypothetical protein
MHADDCDNERELDEMLNNLSLDTPGAACTEIEEAKEILIWDCTRHIDMAWVQRLLYQRLEEATVGNARDDVEHTKRRYTLTCDSAEEAIVERPAAPVDEPRSAAVRLAEEVRSTVGLERPSSAGGGGDADKARLIADAATAVELAACLSA